MKIFVYGTLLQHEANNHYLQNSRYLGPALIEANLYDLGSYPAVEKGGGITIGEIYEIDEQTLQILDKLEKYQRSNPKDSLYTRKVITAQTFTNKKVDVQTYFYNWNKQHQSSQYNPILHGDYRRFLLEKGNIEQWILAYGSNMSVQRLTDRVGDIKQWQRGFLKNFRLTFNKDSANNKNVYANIVYAEKKNNLCPAVAYKLSPTQTQILDGFEGTPHQYLRIGIPFYLENKDIIQTQLYIAHPDGLSMGKLPTNEYLTHIIKGYQDHGFSRFDCDFPR